MLGSLLEPWLTLLDDDVDAADSSLNIYSKGHASNIVQLMLRDGAIPFCAEDCHKIVMKT